MRTTSQIAVHSGAHSGALRTTTRSCRQGPPRLLRRRGRSQSRSQLRLLARGPSLLRAVSEGRQRLTPKLAQGVIIDMVRSLAPVLGAQGVIIHVM